MGVSDLNLLHGDLELSVYINSAYHDICHSKSFYAHITINVDFEFLFSQEWLLNIRNTVAIAIVLFHYGAMAEPWQSI